MWFGILQQITTRIYEWTFASPSEGWNSIYVPRCRTANPRIRRDVARILTMLPAAMRTAGSIHPFLSPVHQPPPFKIRCCCCCYWSCIVASAVPSLLTSRASVDRIDSAHRARRCNGVIFSLGCINVPPVIGGLDKMVQSRSAKCYYKPIRAGSSRCTRMHAPRLQPATIYGCEIGERRKEREETGRRRGREKDRDLQRYLEWGREQGRRSQFREPKCIPGYHQRYGVIINCQQR